MADQRNQFDRSALFRQLLFCTAILGLSWLGMMAVHELGHVIGAISTRGTVQRVVLHPLTISRTDVAPNPHPAIVVWLGPLAGCLLPLVMLAMVPVRHNMFRNVATFFAAFCLIANGAYIGFGSLAGIGDCGEMLRTGTPRWAMWAFGATTITIGLFLWHRLGSLGKFLQNPEIVTPQMVRIACGALLLLVIVELSFSPR